MFANSDALLAQQMHLMVAIGESGNHPSLSHRSMDGSHHSVASSSDDEGLQAASRWGAECYAESPNSPKLFASLKRQVAMELRPAPMIRSSNLEKQSADAARPRGSGRAARGSDPANADLAEAFERSRELCIWLHNTAVSNKLKKNP